MSADDLEYGIGVIVKTSYEPVIFSIRYLQSIQVSFDLLKVFLCLCSKIIAHLRRFGHEFLITVDLAVEYP